LKFYFRKVAAVRKEKFPGAFAPDSFNSTGATNSDNHRTVSFHDPSVQAFLK